MTYKKLPPEILSKATLQGNEYAWPVDEIPTVIESARTAGLVNIGGQLQFRMPDGTYECYWVEVDSSLPETLPYEERVERAAADAQEYFSRLRQKVDFISEWRTGFQNAELDRYGDSLSKYMCFVWYVSDK